jgi:hypothetical protein
MFNTLDLYLESRHGFMQDRWIKADSRPSSQSFCGLLTRRLEQRPAAIADHPVAWAGRVAGIAQVEPGDTHAAALCGGEQAAHRNPAAGALGPESTQVEALDRVVS